MLNASLENFDQAKIYGKEIKSQCQKIVEAQGEGERHKTIY